MSHESTSAQNTSSLPYSPAPSNSSNSMAEQPARSYPSPNQSYGSPQTYSYPPAPPHQHEPYRNSPQNSNMSLPSINLPPIRVQEGHGSAQQPPPPQHQPGQHPLPPPQHPMPQYAYHPPPGQPIGMAPAPMGAMRYQLPPGGEQRILSGGRHKKEIKRRTKTGCLTCRKRRIKCDEAHPVCRNCQKSKRDCLGYDPIFKQQPGPAQIQPAPNSAPTPHQAPVPASAPPTSGAYGGPVPQGYAPATSTGYGPPPPTAGSGHPPYDNYNQPAIDPALDPAMQGAQPPYNGAPSANPPLRGAESASPYSSDVHPIKAKRIRITDIFAIGGHHPPEIPPRATPIPSELDDEFTKMFSNDYCSGLDAILETRWFSANNNALHKILADKSLHEEAVHFCETIRYHQSSYDGMARIFSQEARLIWHMLAVCKQAPPATNGTNGAHSIKNEHEESAAGEDLSLKEVRARFDILESLLTNQNLGSNPLSQLHYPPDLPDAKRAEVDFWEQLGNFVVHADNDAAPPGAIEQALTTMRTVLQQIEARDVIYSLAIARSSGGRVRGFPNSVPAPVDQNPETDLNKLHVAMTFISYESRQSTQQVVARICDMATLSWTVSRAH